MTEPTGPFKGFEVLGGRLVAHFENRMAVVPFDTHVGQAPRVAIELLDDLMERIELQLDAETAEQLQKEKDARSPQ